VVRLRGQHGPVGSVAFQDQPAGSGTNDLAGGGLTLSQLLSKLASEQQADRPIQVISIGVGPEADAGALQQISQATGGRTFVAKDPAAAAQTLVLAFAGRLS
jgi:hypothetical protein